MPLPAIPLTVVAIAVVKIAVVLQYLNWRAYRRLKSESLNREEMRTLLAEEIERVRATPGRKSKATMEHLAVLIRLHDYVAQSPENVTAREVFNYLMTLHDAAQGMEKGVVDAVVASAKKIFVRP